MMTDHAGRPARVRAQALLRSSAAMLIALVLAAGCSSGEDPSDAEGSSSTTPSTATPTTAEPAPRPALDACYVLDIAGAVAPTTSAEPVDCDGEHTSLTYEVGTLPTYLDGHLLAVDSARVQDSLAQTCRRNLAAYLGADEATLALSVLRPVWFSPTLEESDAGADWYRCDLIAVVDTDTLGSLPATLRDAFAGGTGAFGLCGTAQPGTDGFRRVACGQESSWTAIEVVDLGESHPGDEAAQAAGSAPCQAAARSRADDALNYQWGYEWPTAEQWAAGQTYGICWIPS